jgi:hypothetical protein
MELALQFEKSIKGNFHHSGWKVLIKILSVAALLGRFVNGYFSRKCLN